jgi:hypothetical protein
MHSGRTGYRRKFELAHELIPLWNYRTHRRKLINLGLSKVGSQISWETLDEDLRMHLRAPAMRRSL